MENKRTIIALCHPTTLARILDPLYVKAVVQSDSDHSPAVRAYRVLLVGTRTRELRMEEAE